MKYWKSKKSYTTVVPKPNGGTITLLAEQIIEGDYYEKFSFLVEVPESEVDLSKLQYSQSGVSQAAKGFFILDTVPESETVEEKTTEESDAVDEKTVTEPKPKQATKSTTTKKVTRGKKNG